MVFFNFIVFQILFNNKRSRWDIVLSILSNYTQQLSRDSIIRSMFWLWYFFYRNGFSVPTTLIQAAHTVGNLDLFKNVLPGQNITLTILADYLTDIANKNSSCAYYIIYIIYTINENLFNFNNSSFHSTYNVGDIYEWINVLWIWRVYNIHAVTTSNIELHHILKHNISKQ